MLTRIRLLALALVAATFAISALDGAQAGRFGVEIKHVPPLSVSNFRKPPRPPMGPCHPFPQCCPWCH